MEGALRPFASLTRRANARLGGRLARHNCTDEIVSKGNFMSQTKTHDVVAIGNAIVDVMSFADDAFIDQQQMRKGTMQLIDQARGDALYGAMGSGVEVSGGSAANTLAGMASLGAKTGFIGKVAQDELGKIFRHDLNAVGVSFATPDAMSGSAGTGRCLIAVTPDGQRTMNTYLGAAGVLTETDIDDALIASAKILYTEGYMWFDAGTKQAIRKSFDIARKAGTKIAFSLSDAFCVEGNRDEFLAMIKDDFDILFCNEAEACALYPGKSLEDVLKLLQGQCEIVAVTCGADGSKILTPTESHHIPAIWVHELVDTTGAGDLYAAGVMYGLTHGLSLEASGKLGAACASDVITHLGARAQKPLKRLLAA